MNLSAHFARSKPDPYWPTPVLPQSTYLEWQGEPGLSRIWDQAQKLAGAVGAALGQQLMTPGVSTRHWVRVACGLIEASGVNAHKIDALANDARGLFKWSDAQMAQWACSSLALRCEPRVSVSRNVRAPVDAISTWLGRRVIWSEIDPGVRALFARCSGESAAFGRIGMVETLSTAGMSWTPGMVSLLVYHGAKACRSVGPACLPEHQEHLAAQASLAVSLAGSKPSGEDVFFAWAGRCAPMAEALLCAGADLSAIKSLPDSLVRAWAPKGPQSKVSKEPNHGDQVLLGRARSVWEAHGLAALSKEVITAAASARRL